MSKKEIAFTTTELIAKASNILEENGYKRADLEIDADWEATDVRLFEDDYGIVAIVVYETWGALSSKWIAAQGNFVELISKYIGSNDLKSWEGYLVLLTPSLVGKEGRIEVTQIRYDTSRVRKLVVTGDDIKTLEDVKLGLLPLLPLKFECTQEFREYLLDMLPDLLSSKGLPEQAVKTVIKAYFDQKPIIESLHDYRSQDENRID